MSPAIRAVRHAPTDWNREQVFMGTLDPPARAEGLAAAAALGAELREGVDVVLASPLRRAAQTAAAMFPGREIRLDERLRERGMGEWEGRSKAQVRRERPDAHPGGYLDVRVTPPGGEPPSELLERVRSFLAEIAPRARRERVLLVGHNGWILAARLLGGTLGPDAFHRDPTPPLRPLALPAPLAAPPVDLLGRGPLRSAPRPGTAGAARSCGSSSRTSASR